MKQQFFYRIIEQENAPAAELLRCFGENGEVMVPASLAGFPVTSIGAYCFARTSHLPDSYEKILLSDRTAESQMGDASGKTRGTGRYAFEEMDPSAPEQESEQTGLEEQAGNLVEKVILPDTITKFDAYAFYNCRKLKELYLPASAEIIGNDAFMNCTSLEDLYLNCASGQKSGLRQILAQITWNVEVHFTDAVVFFPEYLEYYDEIGPAHVFEMQVEGEGFRIRKAFTEGILQLSEYDDVFPKLSAEEAAGPTIRFAADRLLKPVDLTEEHREWFGTFLSAHEVETALMLFREEKYPLTGRLDQLHPLFLQKWLGSEAMDALMTEAAVKQMPEASATFIQWKQELFGTKKKKRYEFDDF